MTIENTEKQVSSNVNDVVNEKIRLACNGDKQAFEHLVNEYSKLVYSICYRVLKSTSKDGAAEDAAQESFVKIWKNLSEFDSSKSKFSTWAYRISMNTAIDHRRSLIRKNETSFDGQLEKAGEGSLSFSADIESCDEGNITKIGLAKYVDELIVNLPEKQARCLILYFKEELKQTEIAEIIGASVKAVESNILRGKKKLLEILQQRNISLTDLI